MVMEKAPKDMTLCTIECIVMPNGEIIISGKTIGWIDKLGKYVNTINTINKKKKKVKIEVTCGMAEIVECPN